MRKWNTQQGNKPHYIAKNKVTGERKRFDSYTQMQSWYITLSIMEMLNWSSWEVSY